MGTSGSATLVLVLINKEVTEYIKMVGVLDASSHAFLEFLTLTKHVVNKQ